MTKLASTAAALTITLLLGCAGHGSIDGTTQVGKVQGVYIEQFPGVFVERQVAGERAARPAWVYVRFAEPLADGRIFATAELLGELGVEPGDLVQLRFGHDEGITVGPSPDHAFVIALVAKHHTQAAREFGRHVPGSTPDQLSAGEAGFLSSLTSE